MPCTLDVSPASVQLSLHCHRIRVNIGVGSYGLAASLTVFLKLTVLRA